MDIHARDKYGNEVLHYVMQWTAHHTNLIAILVAHGANINALNKRHRSAISIAAFRLDEPIVRLLIDLGADPAALSLDRKIADLIAHGSNAFDEVHGRKRTSMIPVERVHMIEDMTNLLAEVGVVMEEEKDTDPPSLD